MAAKQQLKDSEYHLSLQDIKKIVNAPMRFRGRCILKTFPQTAVRRFKLVNLDMRDLDFERKRLYIREGKGGKSRAVPISEDLLGDLRYCLGTRKKGPLFTNHQGQKLTVRRINDIVADAGRRAGAENPNPKYRNITCHVFRHSFARHWKKQGGSIESLSKILGHTSVKTTLEEYGTEDLAEVQQNYERVTSEMF